MRAPAHLAAKESLAMKTSTSGLSSRTTWTTIVIGALVAGCSPSVTPGLANVPSLGHVNADVRVHDVVANGGDACERSGFPEGEVLRGQLPPCVAEEAKATAPVVVSAPPDLNSWVPSSYPLGVCLSAMGAGHVSTDRWLGKRSLYSSAELVCDVH
jgi:hypothetical protein